MLIFKLLLPTEWADFRAKGDTAGAPIDLRDGYIHFSTADQVAETAAKYFAGVDGLELVAVDADSLGTDLKWEPARGGALFPHLYRPLRLSNVVWTRTLPLGPSGHVLGDLG